MPTTIFERRRAPIIKREPDPRQIMEEGFIKRCPQCWKVWPASEMTEEDGIDRCPNCVDIVTADLIARDQEQFAARLERYQLEPQISQAPLASVVPPSINYITTSAGRIISSAHPLELIRDVATAMLLIGVHFAASDVITYSTDITDVVPPIRTSTLVTLSVIASLAMAPGDHYHLTFNGVTYRDVFCVR